MSLSQVGHGVGTSPVGEPVKFKLNKINPTNIAKIKGKNFTDVITQFWILPARDDKPDTIWNHKNITNEINAA